MSNLEKIYCTLFGDIQEPRIADALYRDILAAAKKYQTSDDYLNLIGELAHESEMVGFKRGLQLVSQLFTGVGI